MEYLVKEQYRISKIMIKGMIIQQVEVNKPQT